MTALQASLAASGGLRQQSGGAAADVDAVVVGAGVVGLATARALAGRGRDVLLLDAGPDFGTGVSSRSSEVVHAGEGEGVVE